jgi:DNA-binding NarL/FixJ family response regulator
VKDTDSNHLIKSIAAVHSGSCGWKKLMGKVLDGSAYLPRPYAAREVYDLTETEIKIIKLVLNGYTNKT